MNFLDGSAVVKLARHDAETEALRGWIAETLAGSLHAFVAYDKRLADVARLRGLPVAVPS